MRRTADAIDIRTASMQLRHPLSDFIRWTESDTTGLVYQSDRLMNFIPKRAFGEGDLEGLRTCLTGAGVTKARMF
jgi:YcxB-like protein